MDNLTDAGLLRQYAEGGSETAFRELVDRHVNLVHSAAMRIVNGDLQMARDIAQAVFTDLARKAGALCDLPQKQETLSGWLYTATRFAAMKAVRAEQTRRAREEEAHKMNELTAETAPDWSELRPILDDAMGELAAADREALLLRVFEGKELRAVGEQLGLSEEAARKRISRALDKLRVVLARRGFTTSSAALSVVIAAHGIEAAPAGLSAALASGALATAASAVAGTAVSLTFLKLMALSKSKTVGIAAGVAVGLGTAFLVNFDQPSARTVTETVTKVTYRTNAATPATLAAANMFGFHWSQLESADYRQYVANLKAIGCPWETLKDMIIADINTLYSPKLAKLRLDPGFEQWWLTADQTRRVRWQHEAEANKIEKEKREILRELLGLDAVEALDAVWGVDAQTKNDLSCIPPDKRGEVAEINVTFAQREGEIMERSMGMMDSVVQAAIKQVRNERRAALEQVLSPSELFEFDLRFSEAARRLRDFSPTFEYAEAEFRAAYAAKEAFEREFGTEGGSYNRNDPQTVERRRLASDEMKAKVRQALGDQRYAEWRRSQDSDFQVLYNFGESHKVPESAMLQIYDMRGQAVAAANKLRNDSSLPYEEARALRREIRATVEKGILEIMGEKTGAEYLKQWGPTLNAIASK